MHLSNQSLLVILVVGIIAGWLAGKVVEGGGFGLIWDLIIGLVYRLIVGHAPPTAPNRSEKKTPPSRSICRPTG